MMNKRPYWSPQYLCFRKAGNLKVIPGFDRRGRYNRNNSTVLKAEGREHFVVVLGEDRENALNKYEKIEEQKRLERWDEIRGRHKTEFQQELETVEREASTPEILMEKVLRI